MKWHVFSRDSTRVQIIGYYSNYTMNGVTEVNRWALCNSSCRVTFLRKWLRWAWVWARCGFLGLAPVRTYNAIAMGGFLPSANPLLHCGENAAMGLRSLYSVCPPAAPLSEPYLFPLCKEIFFFVLEGGAWSGRNNIFQNIQVICFRRVMLAPYQKAWA